MKHSRSIIRRRGIVGMIFLLAATLSVYYLSRSTCAAGGLVPCTNDCNLCYLLVGISNIFQYLTGALLTAAFLLGITIAGLSYMVSGAFPKALNFAKSAFTNSLKGFVLALIAWVIINGIMNIVGYKNPQGGTWYQHVCSGGGAQVANSNKTACDAKNKKLESVTIQCAEQKETLKDNGSGFYVALDTLSEDGSGKTKQLKAIGKYSCDGTTSEEDITAQAEWKASDETQIKVAKGLVEAVAKNMTSESPPYVEAKFQEKNSNQAKVYINACPNTGTIADAETKNKLFSRIDTFAIPKANAQANTSGNTNCKGCGQNDTCHFVYGNKDNPQIILLLQRTNDYNNVLLQECGTSYGSWKKSDEQQLKTFKELVEKLSKGLDYTKEKNSFAVWRSDLIGEKDNSCPTEPTAYGYILNRKAEGKYRMEAHAGPPSYYCLNDSRSAFLFAHEQIGHDFAGLSDEYIECTRNPTEQSKKFNNYNCTSKEKVNKGLLSSDTKWGTIYFPAPYQGCSYTSEFIRSSYNSVMWNGSSFGDANDRTIKYKVDNKTGPAQWAEALTPKEKCQQ